MDFEQKYHAYKALVDRYLADAIQASQPRSLYQPLKYVLAGGGKRIRPILVLLACEAVGGKTGDALHAGAGIEILHNFTLVHDDIMDHAHSRRGRATVHTKWDKNVAILVGDELLALAYRMLLKTSSPRIQDIASVFTEGVVEVCEGQAYDKEFEKKSVTVDDYLVMIGKKTGKMVSVATEIGALIGNGSDAEVAALREYGALAGQAFQIQDDVLDLTGDERKLGKKIGGDVQEGKKTFLYLDAYRRAKGGDRALLKEIFGNGKISRRMVDEVRRIYAETGALERARARVGQDIAEANQKLARLKDTQARAMLYWFSDMLLHRTY